MELFYIKPFNSGKNEKSVSFNITLDLSVSSTKTTAADSYFISSAD